MMARHGPLIDEVLPRHSLRHPGDPGGMTTTMTYDPAGNELTSTDANGVTTTNTYTPGDHVATTTYSGLSAPSVFRGGAA